MRRWKYLRGRIAFVVGCVVVLSVAAAAPEEEVPAIGIGEMAVTIHLDPQVDACGYQRIEVPDVEYRMWVRQDPMPSEWADEVSGVLVWSDESAVFTADDGTELRYTYEQGDMECTWG